jgi:tRNA G18 (ribose-2'-O)-methylase SpoU
MPKQPRELYVIAHNIRSLHNVGSIFRYWRTAFGVSKIYLTGYTGAPPDPKISQGGVGCGTVRAVGENPVCGSADQKAPRAGVRIVALENNVK